MPKGEVMPPEVEDVVDSTGDEVVEDVAEETPAEEIATEGDGAEQPEPEAGAEAGEEEPADEEAEGEEGAEGEEEEESPVNSKFKTSVYNKETKKFETRELDIDKRFHGLMKDPDGEKLIRELHEKAYGLDSVKERFVETKNFASQVVKENDEIKEGLTGLRNMYQSAVQSGNLHKLDGFFAKMNIPQDVVMRYAIEKAALTEMDPAQRNAILAQNHAEQRAEEEGAERQRLSETMASHVSQLKLAQMETLMVRPEVDAFAKAYDAQMGREGAFREEVVRTGQLAWFQEKKDLSADQAIRHVITQYGSLVKNPATPGQQQPGQGGVQQAAGTQGANGKALVQKTTKTIPNIQGRSSSPLKSKPRSVEDLKKIYKDNYAE